MKQAAHRTGQHAEPPPGRLPARHGGRGGVNAKGAELKAEIADVERQLDGAGAVTEKNGRLALSVYDFSQNLVKIWDGSDSAQRRTILECVSLNRVLTDASLRVTKRRPFDWLAERPFLRIC